MSTYGKALVAVLYAGLVVAYSTLTGDGRITPDEAVSIAIAVVTAITVYVIPLAPRYKSAKSIAAAVLAVLQLLTTVILGGVQPDEWLLLAITFGSALGIYVAPARTIAPAGPGTGDVVVKTGTDR